MGNWAYNWFSGPRLEGYHSTGKSQLQVQPEFGSLFFLNLRLVGFQWLDLPEI